MENTLTDYIPLSNMVQALRTELINAVAHSENSSIHFGIEKIDLELSVEVTHSTEGGGKIQFWVISAEAGGKISSVNSHKVYITLHPVDKNGKSILISAKTIAEPN